MHSLQVKSPSVIDSPLLHEANYFDIYTIRNYIFGFESAMRKVGKDYLHQIIDCQLLKRGIVIQVTICSDREGPQAIWLEE